MIRELAHLVRHTPGTLRMMRALPQAELYARLIERADAAGLGARRVAVVAGLAGRVVEIGCGTGAMFPAYRGLDIDVVAIEPDPAFAELAARAATPRIAVVRASGDALPLGDASAGAAVLALVLCSVRSVDAVLHEVARVVRPGGALRLIEHVRSARRIPGALMDAVDPVWLRINRQGCHLNRDPLPALARAGFAIDRVEPFQIWSAGLPAFPMRAIHARRQ